MDLHSFFLLFPSIFMLHELEEILFIFSLYGSEPATATTTFIGGVYTFQNQCNHLSGIHTLVDYTGLKYIF